MTKTCKECGLHVDVECSSDMEEFFYLKRTRTGDYHLNTCVQCERKKRNERYAKEREQ